jgi:hypothetical protein
VNHQPNLFDDKPRFNPTRWQQPIAPILIQKDSVQNSFPDLIPDDCILSLTRHYDIQSIHISKILQLLFNQTNKINGLTRQELANTLSIPLARIQGTFSTMRKIELVTSDNRLSQFGELIYHTKPYLDDSGLLWFFHFLLASNASNIIWGYLFDNALNKNGKLYIRDITQDFSVLSGKWSEKSLNKKVPREVTAIFNAYLVGFLSPLQLISKFETGEYYYESNTVTVPDLIWLAALLAYRDRYYPNAPSLEVPLIVDAHFAPGRLFRANEMETRTRLDAINDLGLISVETRSGLDQVRFKRDITWLSALALYLQGGVS